MSNRFNNNDFEYSDDFECYSDYNNYEYDNNNCSSFDSNSSPSSECNRHRVQRHVHEYNGSTKLACADCSVHNHRFAGVTGEAIPSCNSHVHRLETNTDFYNHFHEISDTTGPAIPVGNGRHVHFVKGTTTEEDDHTHKYNFATLIEGPTVCEGRR